jgi:hypothetical protein
MPEASDVTPAKWEVEDILFDNGTYSVIVGKYKGTWSLGERWNGQGEDRGFPSQFGHPVWHVVPEFLCLYVLHGILAELTRHPSKDAERQIAATLKTLGKIDFS